MEIKYTVKEKIWSSEVNSASASYKGVSTVSCENIIAFTKVVYNPNPIKHKIPIFKVCVADVNTPFESHVILESFNEIRDLIFHSDGHQLLVILVDGMARLFFKGSNLTSWNCTQSSHWPGERILHTNFFYTRDKPCIQKTDIKVNVPYLEKFQTRSHEPSLCTISGSPRNGFFVITGSGLFIACAINDAGVLEQEITAVLGRVRDSCLKATAALSPCGQIHVVTWKPDLIRGWTVELQYSGQERSSENLSGLSGSQLLEITVRATQSFVPSINALETHNETSDVTVSHLLFPELEDPASLLVCMEIDRNRLIPSENKPEVVGESGKADGETITAGSVLISYQLKEKSREILKYLSPSNLADSETKNILVKTWTAQSEWVSVMHKITAIATPQSQLCLGAQVPYVISVATSNGGLFALNRETMNVLGKTSIPTIRQDDMPPPKRSSSERYVVSLCPTWTSLHLVTLDTEGSVHLSSLLKQSDIGSSWAVYIMLLLEYSLISGKDWLDILMAMPPNSAVTLADCVSETFYQHPTQLVQHLSTRFLVIKNSVMRLTSSFYLKSIEVRLQAHLSAMVKIFRLFRPVTLDGSSTDPDAISVFQAFVENRSSLETPDLDKALDQILFSANIVDLQVDCDLLKDYQSTLQYIADLSLYLLLLLVQNPKYDLAKDPKILVYLRELLLTARAWHRHRQMVSPQMLCKSDTVDVWATLYRLLTKLAHILPNEPDTGFIVSCGC